MIGFSMPSLPDTLADSPADPVPDAANRALAVWSAVPHSGPRPAPPL